MGHSLSQIYLHIIFSTKDREPFLHDAELREKTHAYLVGVCQQQGSPSLRIGGVADHVHILCRLAKTLSVANLVRELKRDSSKWIKDQPAGSPEFHWQQGYGAFSISPGHVETLIDYIAHQEDHHKQTTFQDEFRKICQKYGVPLDERYAWDQMGPWNVTPPA